jgi:lambda repressor-like predicted transcriptional regulator
MGGKRHSDKIKSEAAGLRRKGYSYSEMNKKLGVPTSTLATWLASSPDNPFTKKEQLAHLAAIRPLANSARRKQKRDRLMKVELRIRGEIQHAPLKNMMFQKSLLAVFYWAEGSKFEGVSGLRFVNTDPNLLQLYMSLLRKCYDIDEERFRVRLHLHYYHKKRVARDFWSTKLDIPSSQFASAFVKKRGRKKRFRKNFMGICFIYYPNGDIREELLALGQELHKQYLISS